MMRSMYSAVSGLKTHQTRMDVIGNNIANVNTVAFKSSSVTFSDILYQTTSNASGANATTGTGGVNAEQIGLGTTAAATKVSITSAGASETTGNPFDIRLTDKNSTNFFIVNNGSENVFTRSGSFYVDGSGNLCMSSTGYTVMGWQVDETTGEIRKDTVSALRIMQEKNLTSAPEATTQATIAGVLDENDTDVKNDAGRVMNLNFYDNLGYQYTAKFAIKSTGTDGKYTVELTSVLDSNNQNIIKNLTKQEISKIFGELFFAIDPGYRGKAGEISTQYSNLHSDPGEKFYIPENVYIIGTMNDIDRSVDSFDFAIRRRFRFVELRADERLEMLASLENEELEAEAIRRMAALNKAIAEVEDLNENYQIGASYFLKLKTLDFDQLWTDYLQPLLQEYIQGMYDEEGIMNRFARAYGYQKPARGDANEAAQDQG